MKIAIMGGTFNPIHHGHLILSEFIKEKMDLDKIIFIPTGNPPHKKGKQVLDKNLRKKMVDLAIKGNPDFINSTIEVDRDDISYTIDTINTLKTIYPEDELFMIIGGDSLLQLDKWNNHEEIIGKINIIVADRYDSDRIHVIKMIESLNKSYNGNIISVNSPIIEISSTDIRDKIKQGTSIKYLLPESVENFILSKDLYK